MWNFNNLPLNCQCKIKKCICDERIELFGIRQNEIIEIICECPFKGTILVKTKNGNLCVRRNEIIADLEEV